MNVLISRNLKLFFRDRMAVFFSLLAVFISITLYVLFLASTMTDGELGQLTNGREILNLWLLGGLMSMGAVTTTLAGFETMITDRVDGKEKDFFVSSMPRWRLAASYIIAAIVIGFVMVSITLLIGMIYFYAADGVTLTMYQIGRALLISLGNVTVSAVIFFPLMQLLKSRGAYSNLSALLGTLVGFLLGVYIPIGALPSFAQTLIKVFPITHGCALLRSLFTHDLLTQAIPASDIVKEVEAELGNTLTLGDHLMSTNEHVLMLAGIALIFALLSLWCYHRRKAS